MKLSKLGYLISSIALLILLAIPLSSSFASAQTLSVSLSMQPGCKSIASPTSLTVVSGTNVSLTVTNGDSIVSQSISGGIGASGTVYNASKNSIGSDVIVLQLGILTGTENILFTPIPTSYTNPAVETNYCTITPHSIPVPSTLTIYTTPAPVAPKTTTTTSTSTKSTPQTQTTTSTTTTLVAPSPPVFGAALVEGKSQDITKPIEFSANKAFVISGQTVPSATVNLVIHSIPKKVALTSNSDGSWSYLVTGLAPGSHYIEASVTDPASKLASPSAKIVSFKIDAVTVSPAPKQKTNSTQYIVGGIVLVILIGLLIYALRKDKKPKPKAEIPIAPIPPTVEDNIFNEPMIKEEEPEAPTEEPVALSEAATEPVEDTKEDSTKPLPKKKKKSKKKKVTVKVAK